MSLFIGLNQPVGANAATMTDNGSGTDTITDTLVVEKLSALLSSLVPILIIMLMQIGLRSFWDANNAPADLYSQTIGLLHSLVAAAVFQVSIKWLIGGPAPALLRQPGHIGNGFGKMMYDRRVCTGDRDKIDDALELMPSGHSTAAFAGFRLPPTLSQRQAQALVGPPSRFLEARRDIRSHPGRVLECGRFDR
ncbi:hypothetical protein LTR28_000613 [Elasticomyces elasticus]|nr:hypothetical protein LTR28_000613 [Elasticomyces elasticus]